MGRPVEALGFAGMVAAGVDPDDAYDHLCALFDKPEVRRIFDVLAELPDGPDVLAELEAQWAKHGYVAPWKRPGFND